jgi:DNA polymerase-3 subunit delta'
MQWNLCGHDLAIDFLREHTKPEKMRQAYLITGPDGVGRKSLALAFIKAICCQHPPASGEFCNQCTACRQIDAMAFSDLTIIEQEGNKEIKIDQIREMQKLITLSPFQAPKRFVLIPNFQKATAGAANALLKSLEEPPPRAIIILTADARESLLETIASRCEQVRLGPMTVDDTQMALQDQFKLSEDQARHLAHLTSGRIGASLRYQADPQFMDALNDILIELEDQLEKSYRARLQYVDELMRQKNSSPREQAGKLVPVWLGFWRDCLIRAAKADIPLVNVEHREWIEKAASQMPLEQIQRVLKAHEHALEQLEAYVNARLVLENLLLLPPRLR